MKKTVVVETFCDKFETREIEVPDTEETAVEFKNVTKTKMLQLLGMTEQEYDNSTLYGFIITVLKHGMAFKIQLMDTEPENTLVMGVKKEFIETAKDA